MVKYRQMNVVGFYSFKTCLLEIITPRNTQINTEYFNRYPYSYPGSLTNDFSAGVFRCDGNSAGGTLTALLKPKLDAGCTEHMMVTADHRLTDLHMGEDKAKGQ